MGRWYLVRHGKTAWNVAGRVQGHADPPLGDAGQVDAQLIAARLVGVPFAAAYSSDLARAVQTTQVLLRSTGVPCHTSPDLRELAYGRWEGMTYPEVEAAFPQEYADLMRGALDFAPPGGETVPQLIARVTRSRDHIMANHSVEEDLLIVAHSGSIKALVVALLGLPQDVFWRFGSVPGSISIISVFSPGATLDRWNDVSHLEGGDA